MRSNPLPLVSLFAFVLIFLACNDASTSKSQPTFPAVSSDGVEIDYLVRGEGDVALVFVHGWSCDKTYWKEQIPALSQNYKVVAVDLGGHGKSGLNREDWTMDAFGEDVAAVVNALELQKVILIGHSLGGRVIVETAQRLPNKVLGLIGVDTWMGLNLMTEEQVENLLKPFREDFVTTTKQMVKGMFLEGADSVFMEQIMLDMASTPSSIGISSGYYYQMWNAEEAFSKIEMPLKLIYAADRNIYDESKFESFNIDARPMSGVGHFLMMENPTTFNQLLNTTVKEIID